MRVCGGLGNVDGSGNLGKLASRSLPSPSLATARRSVNGVLGLMAEFFAGEVDDGDAGVGLDRDRAGRERYARRILAA